MKKIWFYRSEGSVPDNWKALVLSSFFPIWGLSIFRIFIDLKRSIKPDHPHLGKLGKELWIPSKILIIFTYFTILSLNFFLSQKNLDKSRGLYRSPYSLGSARSADPARAGLAAKGLFFVNVRAQFFNL